MWKLIDQTIRCDTQGHGCVCLFHCVWNSLSSNDSEFVLNERRGVMLILKMNSNATMIRMKPNDLARWTWEGIVSTCYGSLFHSINLIFVWDNRFIQQLNKWRSHNNVSTSITIKALRCIKIQQNIMKIRFSQCTTQNHAI